MFVTTNDGKIVNLDHIVTAEEPRSGIGFSVMFADGRKERLLLPVADLDALCGTIVPAPPGFAVFEICVPPVAEAAKGLVCLDPKPIIAFRVFAATDRPVPITADGPVSSSNGWTFAVRGPEGPWVGPDGDYTHARDFKAACERELADTVARAARKAA
ncbi:hypothetical protein [Methylobacterium platani]|uniref:Uncharacterized protein n=2 Tax=Methylobacterium platani TaxID=427683 RepID=A0A179S4F6_9HYPH|nr:hypothetical protein [Methylobacterium platani]KMO15141.1 hypothetical protein SQ03_17775 [Methylobacterium platani JCM 14648]OAS20781.1 hypothetical protein A5481_22060 [Methylobacterium platani]